MAADAEQTPHVSLVEISRVLDETARLVRLHAGMTSGILPSLEERALLAASEVRAIIAVRQMRSRQLGVDATDAAWSMMLELYAARLEGRILHQTGLSIAAGVAETTAFRVTHRMLVLGHFTGAPHPTDRRLMVIGLSDAVAQRIAAYLAATRTLAGWAA